MVEPAASIIRSLGHAARIARRIGKHRTTVQRWTMPAPQGTGGVIPQEHWPVLIAMGREVGVTLTAESFMPPRQA